MANKNLFNKIYDFLKNYILFRKSLVMHTDQNRFRALTRKVYTLLLVICDLALLPLAILGVFIVRVLQPFALIRFYQMSHRIGHFAANIELYMCKRDIEKMQGKRAVDIFYCKPPICNRQLKKMWGRVLHICYFANFLDRVNCLLPGGEKHTPSELVGTDIDIDGLLARAQPHLSFTPHEEQKGLAALRKMGIPQGASFICFHVRDPAYLANHFKVSERDFYYHNYRDSNIQNCMLVAEEMANRGYFILRMGAVVKEEFKSDNPKIIDYATKYRTDFLDIFMLSKCRFFISTDCGLTEVAAIFRRPVAWINRIPFEVMPTAKINDLVIPKKHWLRKERRFMTFREIINSGAAGFYSTKQFDQLGIEVIENTPEEIKALAVEMDERLNKTWQGAQEDEDLQNRFWSLFKPVRLRGKNPARIGFEFLRQNRELLD